jgi:hypothetical protein
MKIIKKILNDINTINEKRFFVGNYNGIKFLSTEHFLNREMERSDLSPNDFEKMLKKISNELINNNYEKDTYLFYIKEFEQGFILNYDPENKKVILITYLPRNRKSSSKNKTKRVILESKLEADKLIEKYYDLIKNYLWEDENSSEKLITGKNVDFMIDVNII